MPVKKIQYMYCAVQPESLTLLRSLREKKRSGQLGKRQERQLLFLEERVEEGQIWLLPALIFAAANHEGCREFLDRADSEKLHKWQELGTVWMERFPVFGRRIGWKEQKPAVSAAGFFLAAQDGSKESVQLLRRFFSECWSFLWERIKQAESLGIQQWEELLKPWEDSEAMTCAMSAVYLYITLLQKKTLTDTDRIWRYLRRLKAFSDSSIRKNNASDKKMLSAVSERKMVWGQGNGQNAEQIMNERLEWLFAKFKNPQKPAYLKEKRRITSEWTDTLFGVMEKAGLPRSACESMQIGKEEVMQILECFPERMSERQYITFLLLYSVSRELVIAGQAVTGRTLSGK